MVSITLLCVLIVSSLWTVLVVRSAIVSMHASGKSREQIQAVKRGYSWLQRLFLVNIKDSTAGSPKYNRYRAVLEKFLFGYIIAGAIIWVLIIIGIFVPRFNVLLIVLLCIKIILIDCLGVGAYLHLNLKRDAGGTLHWKWTKL